MVPAPRRVLIVGAGAREHALAWKLATEGVEIFAAPGNAGTGQIGTNLDAAATDIPRLVELAREHAVDLTVVGPEAPLVAGITDTFTAASLPIFGPSRAAARIEGSKLFCKQILRRGDVPTGLFEAFTGPARAREWIEAREDMPVVVKADGLAAGKGVFVCADRGAALAAIDALAADPVLSRGGILIEERFDGVEVSVMAITDGRTIVTLPPVQDHKAAFDGDTGPNTGGMGAYAPTPFVDAALLADIEARILVPTVHALRRGKVPFQGVLFAGLMLTPQGPKLLEFNARFGDPECQTLLCLLESGLGPLLAATAARRLEEVETPVWKRAAAVTVVIASEGYPAAVQRGLPIRGLEAAAALPSVQVFHGATRSDGGRVVADGGRAIAVTATGDTLARAKLQAYTAVREIRWQGAWCRKDIAEKGLLEEHRRAAAADGEGA